MLFEAPDFNDVMLTSGDFEWIGQTSAFSIQSLRYRPADNRVLDLFLSGFSLQGSGGVHLDAQMGTVGTSLVPIVPPSQLDNRVTDFTLSPITFERVTGGSIFVTVEEVPAPGETPDDPVLPDPAPPSCATTWCFHGVPILAGALGTASPIYIDPAVAIGYEYAILSPDDVFFGSVVIPAGNGLTDGDPLEVHADGSVFELLVGTAFDFIAEGLLDLDFFSVEGIDPALALDIDDPLAFVTGLTFVGPGGNALSTSTEVELTMNAIPLDLPSVPEPGTVTLLGLGLLALGLGRPAATRRTSA